MKKSLLIFLFFITGCQTDSTPVLEYTIALTAIKAAENANAVHLAPGYWNRAQQFYQKGQMYYKEKQYRLSSEAFKQTRLYAEKAENMARSKKAQSGDPPF